MSDFTSPDLITVRCKSGPRTLPADVRGVWAVNMSTGIGPPWTVTHVPSGLALRLFSHKEKALEAAEYMQEHWSDGVWATEECVPWLRAHQLDPEMRELAQRLEDMGGVKVGPEPATDTEGEG